MDEQTKNRLATLQRGATLVALVGGAVCAAGYWSSPARFFEAYLFAFVFVSGIGLGCLALVMLHHLVGGKWGRATRRILEAASWPLVIAPLMALPLATGIESLYPWADSAALKNDALSAEKATYLNTDFFQLRAVGYLLVWAALAAALSWGSRLADRPRTSTTRRSHWLRRLSALGLVVFVLTATFAAIDWMMSLEPHWFSAIYGVIVIAGQAAAAFAAAIVVLCLLRGDSHLKGVNTPDVFQDLGNLLLASVAFWIYVVFSQFLIIWSGNLAEETPWYLVRSRGGWQWVALALVLLHFAAPFAALLSKHTKRKPRFLAGVAALVAIMHVVDVYWLVMPALRETLNVHWLDVAAAITLASLWKAVGAWRLRGAALTVPAEDNEEGFQHGNFGTTAQPS